MDFVRRFKIFGRKEFWRNMWMGMKRGMEINKRLIEINKLFIFLVILNLICMPIKFIFCMLALIFKPSIIEGVGESMDDLKEELDM